MRLLLVDDDIELLNAITLQLKNAGYNVDTCDNGIDAECYIESKCYDGVILDRMLPGKDGLTVLKNIRKKKILVPVILVTGMGELGNKIEGLDAGADDYISKPFAVEELKARLRALLRRPIGFNETDHLEFSNISLDVNNAVLKSNTATTTLSKKENMLLEFFLRNKEQVLSREQILSKVWGLDSFVEDGNVDTYIHFLRKRLKNVGSKAVIKTVHGMGYRMEKGE